MPLTDRSKGLAALFRLGLALLFSASVLGAPIGAQSSASSVAGRAVDISGATVSGAQIVIRNTDKGTVRKIMTGRDGTFRADGLVSGAYTVEARGGGLALKPSLRLTLTLGSSREFILLLRPESVAQSAGVTGRRSTVEGNTVAPPTNTAEASLSSFLPGLTVTYLPNRNRDLFQFTALAAGAQADEGEGVILNGQRADQLGTSLDGTSFVSPLFGGPRGAADRELFLPLTAVREFEIVRSGGDATIGSTASGLINIATKGGVNRPRGEAFYTGRPSQFSSADAFGHALDNVQNAFGFSYGGPIRRDHSFYFLSVEQDFVNTPFFIQFEPKPLELTPPLTLTSQQGQVIGRQSPTAGFGRYDLNLNPRNALSVELGMNRIRSRETDHGLSRSTATVDHASSMSGQSTTGRVGLTSAASSTLFNSAVVAWSSDHRNITPRSLAPEQVINGFGILGGDSAGQHLYTTQRTQVLDDVTVSRGHNALSVGGNVAVDPAYEQQEFNTNGRFDYNSLTDYLNNAPRRFQQTFITGDTQYRGTVTQFGLYLSGRTALRPNLFLTAGVRWDAQFNPQPPHANPALAVTGRIPNDLKQWQPRLGIAWNPTRTTVVRLSSGLYAGPTPATFFHRVSSDSGTQTITVDSYFDPGLLILTGANTGSPHSLAAPPSGLQTPHTLVSGISPTFRNPTAFQLAASVDQQLTPKLEATIGYVRSSTWALERQLDENLAPPTISPDGTPVFTAPRPIAGIGRLLVEQSNAHSTYDGGFLTVNVPLSRRSQLMLNYTLARTGDDDSSSGPYSPSTAPNSFDLQAERGYSSLDVRHTLNVNAIFNLPLGLKLNPLLTARSGLPYTPIVGFDTQGDANDLNDRAVLNGKIAPRNALRQPGFTDLDLRVVKDFTLKGEGHHLDLFMDILNATGSGNRRFAPDALDIYGTPAQPIYSAGLPLYAPGVGSAGGPRTIQFTARLVGF